MYIHPNSLKNLIPQKSSWNHTPTVAKRIPAVFVDKLEKFARQLDSGEPLDFGLDFDSFIKYLDSLSDVNLNRLKSEVFSQINKRSLKSSAYLEKKMRESIPFLDPEELPFFKWLLNCIDNEEQLISYHVREACKILSSKYSEKIDFRYSENDIKIYPKKRVPVEKEMSDDGAIIEKIPSKYICLVDEEIGIYAPYDSSGKLQLLFKKIPGHRFSYKKNGKGNSWRFPLESAETIVRLFPNFVIDNSVYGQIKLNHIFKEKIKKEKLELVSQKAEKISSFLYQMDLKRYGLFPHQESGIKWLVYSYFSDYKGGILADQMGLGKTWTAAIAAHNICKENKASLYVICPASIVGNWEKELKKLDIKATIFSDHFQKIPTPNRNSKYFVIFDEAHRLQDDKSKRFKSVEKLIMNRNCIGKFLLTGTPIKNGRPINLYPLLLLLRHPLTSNKRDYEKNYCNAYLGKIGDKNIWINTGASNLDELSKKTSNVILRRFKKDCLNLPEKIRSISIVQRSLTVEKEYFKMFEERWSEHLRKLKAGEIKQGSEALVKIGILRKCSSYFKINKTLEIVENLLNDGQSVVVFCEFLDTINELEKIFNSKKISCEKIVGSTPKDKRTNIVERFQNKKFKVFLGSVKAGGVGLTLTAATHLILHDRPWTPGDAEQAEDRCHRIGQSSTVNVYWPQLGEIDEIVDTVLDSKSENIDVVLKNKNVSFVANNLVELQKEIVKYYEDEYGI